MKMTMHFAILLGGMLLGATVTHAATYVWGGATGNWDDGSKWTPAGAPPQTGNAADSVQFSNNATANYTATYVGQPSLATAFHLNQLIFNGGATTATGTNVINRNEDVFHNLRFASGVGGIVNSTSDGVGYQVNMAVVVGPSGGGGNATLNLSGNGTSLVTLNQGIFPDVSVFPFYDVNVVKTGTSTFELNGTMSETVTVIQEGAVQFGTAGQASLGLINLGHTSGTADARILLHNGAGLANTGDITVVNSADGGTRTLQSTATGIGQNVSVAGDIAINHSLGLRIDSGTNDAIFNLSGAISGSGDLIVTGTGRVYTTGSMAGFTGEVVVESGSYADAGSLFGGGSTGPVTVGTGTGDAGMNFTTNGATYAQIITIGAGAGERDFSVTQNGTLTGGITFNNAADFIVDPSKAFVIEGGLTGAVGGLDKQGTGTLTLSAATPASLGYTAPTTVSDGTLIVNRNISNSSVIVGGDGTLSGSGSVGTISGSGTLSPGNSPGILTTTQIDPTGGLDFAFEFTNSNASGGTNFGSPTNSLNDVSRITGTPIFTGDSSLNSGNIVDIYLNTTLTGSAVFDAGFFTDNSSDFLSKISGATYNYYLKDTLGSIVFGGVNYSTLNLAEWNVTLSTVALTTDFGSGSVSGRSMELAVTSIVPEPSRMMLGLFGFAGVLFRRRRVREC